MRTHHHIRDRLFGTFREAGLQKLWIVFLVLALIAIPLALLLRIKQEHRVSVTSPDGSIRVEAFWPEKVDVDIDLWLQSPGDEKPVGYSHVGDRVFNLQRDDRGMFNDPTDYNYEIAVARSISAGEHVVNVHWYRNGSSLTEVPVTIVVSVMQQNGAGRNSGSTMKTIFPPKKVILHKVSEEITVVRFTLDAKGILDPNSVNNLNKPLRPGASDTMSGSDMDPN